MDEEEVALLDEDEDAPLHAEEEVVSSRRGVN